MKVDCKKKWIGIVAAVAVLLLIVVAFGLTKKKQQPIEQDDNFLSFEEVFQNSLDPDLPSFVAAEGSNSIPAYKLGRFLSTEEEVIRGAFYILYPGDRLSKTLPEEAAVKGEYLFHYESRKYGIRLKSLSLSTQVGDVELSDVRLQLPDGGKTIPLTTGELVTVPLNVERIGKDNGSTGIWMKAVLSFQGKEYWVSLPL